MAEPTAESSRRPSPRRAAPRHRFVTNLGALFLIATAIIGFSAFNTGNNLSYLFLSVLISFLGVSAAAMARGLGGLSVARVVPRHVHSGEPFTVRLRVTSHRRRLSAHSVALLDVLDDGTVAGACYILRIRPGETIECLYDMQAPRRGLYRFSETRLVSSFPFGFFRRSLRVPGVSEMLVFPRIEPLRAWALHSPVDVGDREAPGKGMGADLYGLRDYQIGDSARLIHWKVSARTGRLVAREFETEEKKRITLLLDNAVADPRAPEVRPPFERAVIAAASMASAYLARGFQVQLATRAGRVPMGAGEAHRLRILRALAQIELAPRRQAPPLTTFIPVHDEAVINIRYLPDGPPPEDVQELLVYRTPPFASLEV